MVKITFEIVNPISALGKKIATRKIEKINAKIDKLNSQKSKLESKFFNDSKKVDSDKVTEATEKIEQQTKQMSKDDVSKKFGNKIIFAKNERNNFLHADKGNIDEFIKYAKSTKFFVVSKDPNNPKQFRVFHNRATLNGLAIAHAKKNGWEISQ